MPGVLAADGVANGFGGAKPGDRGPPDENGNPSMDAVFSVILNVSGMARRLFAGQCRLLQVVYSRKYFS